MKKRGADNVDELVENKRYVLGVRHDVVGVYRGRDAKGRVIMETIGGQRRYIDPELVSHIGGR